MSDDLFDVFLSHNSRDKPAVTSIAEALRGGRGLKVWLDAWELPPGRPWIDELEAILKTVRSVALFLGQDGMGAWETPEMRVALNEMVRRRLPVFAVLLPGAPPPTDLSAFLTQNTWVDLRGGLTEEGLDRLQWGITGKRPALRPSSPRPAAPRLHNLPFSTLGPLFKGRDDQLRTLGDGQATAITQAETISGLGGIGKTRLAVEHAWRSGDRYDTVLFVVADSPQALRSGLAQLARPDLLNLPEHAEASEDSSIAAVLRWLREHDHWLVILDNVDTKEAEIAVLEILPSFSTGRVLITSRLRQWPPGVRRQPVETLSPAEAERFLLERTAADRSQSEDDADAARRLAETLGNLPLALEQAAAYISHHQMSLSAYLDDWERQRETVLHWYDGAVMQYPAPIAVTWQTTFRQLSPAAATLLQLTAYLAPEPIPVEMFEAEAAIVEAAVGAFCEEQGAPVGDSSIKPAIAELASFSMVTREAASFTVHRMVQEVLRSSIAEERRREWIERSLRLVNDFSPAAPSDVRTWPVWDRLRPHVAIVAQHADAASIAAPTARLMAQLSNFLETKSLNREAEPLIRRALKINEDSLGPAHSEVAVCLNNLAQLLQTTNRLGEAEPLMRRALQIDEDSSGPRHPNVARDLTNLAQLLQATNRLDEAEPLMRRALEIDEKSFGPRHPEVAIDLNNMAQLLQATNRLDEAEPLIGRALQIDEESFGPRHPNVAIRLNNLAQLLQATNRFVEAEPLMRRSLQIDEEFLGPQHPKVAIRLNNLAFLLKATHRLDEAEPLMFRTLQIFEESFGPRHPSVATGLANLASLLLATHRLAEAEPLMRRALEIDEESFGPRHPEVATDLNNLAHLLQTANRLDEAAPLLSRALEILEESLGSEHPKTIGARQNLTALVAKIAAKSLSSRSLLDRFAALFRSNPLGG